MNSVVMVGNPRPGWRTRQAAELGPALLEWGEPGVAAHTLVGEVHLKPVLNEIGASCPTPALYLIDSEWRSSPTLETWLAIARAALRLS